MARYLALAKRLSSTNNTTFSRILASHQSVTPPPQPFIADYAFSIPNRTFFSWGTTKPQDIPLPSESKSIESHEKISEINPFSPSLPSVDTALSTSDAMAKVDQLTEGAAAVNVSQWHGPVDHFVDLLSWFHETTGLPWWLTIISTSLVARIFIFPLMVVQTKKVEKIATLLPHLARFVPKPGSGIPLRETLTQISRARLAVGCPSFLWALATLSVQVPYFVVSMLAIRRMCLQNYPGFDCGGVLWFADLTSFAHDPIGAIMPLCISGIHLFTVNTTFASSKVEVPGLGGFLLKCYRIWLKFLTLPMFFSGFAIPQGSLLFWVTNSTCNIAQLYLLRQQSIRKMIGLGTHETRHSAKKIVPKKPEKSLHNLTSDQLLYMASCHLESGKRDLALDALRVASAKEPERAEVHVALGKVLIQTGLRAEAKEHFVHAIDMAKDDNVLIGAYLGAGAAYFQEGNKSEAMTLFRKLAEFQEPEEYWAKPQYFQGLVTLASVLVQEGRKDEASVYLHKAAKYDPKVEIYLEELKNKQG